MQTKLTMFRPIWAINHKFIAHKADALPTETFVKPRSLLPHFHRPRARRSVVTENVHSTLKAKVSVSSFLSLLAALKLPVGFHIVAVVCVAVPFKLGAFICLYFANIAIAQRAMFLVDHGAFGPSHLSIGWIEKLKRMVRAAMSGVWQLDPRNDSNHFRYILGLLRLLLSFHAPTWDRKALSFRGRCYKLHIFFVTMILVFLE